MVGFQGIEGDFHVDPAADAVGNLRAVHHVPENAFPATAVEPGDRMFLSFGIGGKAQPLLQRRLHGQATGLSSILVCHPVTLHGPVSRDYIPEHAVQNVLDARAAAGNGRFFTNYKKRSVWAVVHPAGEHVTVAPVF